MSTNTRNIIAAIAAIACCNIAIGLTFQLNPLLLEQAGWSKTAIGAVVAMGPLGILIAAHRFPWAIGTFGNRAVIASAIVVFFASLLLFNVLPFEAWFGLRLVFGLSIAAMFTASEAWLLSFSDERNRGRVFGIFTSVLTFTFAIGPLIIPYTGINGWLPWLVGIAFIVPGLAILMLVKPGPISAPEDGHGIFATMRQQPLLFLCIASFTFFESIMIPFFTIFGLQKGLTLEAASFILGFGIVGCALLYFPYGYLVDHSPKIVVALVSIVVAGTLSLALIPAINHWSIWPVILALRLFAVGPYMIAFAMIGTLFKGPQMLNAAAGASMLWGLGGFVAPPITGLAIDAFGANAMPVMLALLYVVLIGAFAANGWKLTR